MILHPWNDINLSVLCVVGCVWSIMVVGTTMSLLVEYLTIFFLLNFLAMINLFYIVYIIYMKSIYLYNHRYILEKILPVSQIWKDRKWGLAHSSRKVSPEAALSCIFVWRNLIAGCWIHTCGEKEGKRIGQRMKLKYSVVSANPVRSPEGRKTLQTMEAKRIFCQT